MDNTPDSSSGHGQRKNRGKSKRKTVKQKKRKSQTTPSFRANEAEVQKLLSNSSSSFLDNTSNHTTLRSKPTEEDEMNEFFCARSAKTSTPRRSRRKRESSERDLPTGSDGTYDIDTGDTTDIEDYNGNYSSRIKQWQDYDDDDDGESDGNEEIMEEAQEIDNDYSQLRSSNSGGQSTKQNTTTSSTFIEIELDDPLILPGLQRKKHHFDDDALLYRPTTKPNLQLKMVLDKFTSSEEYPHLKPSKVRMLNRFYEQAKSSGVKVDETLVKEFLDNETSAAADGGGGYVIQKKLYRSICDYKFKPIFVAPSPNLQQLPDRKFIKLYMRHLRFTEHQNVLEEHRKSNDLADLYDLYTSNISERICEKLWMELQTERKILMQLNAKSDQCTMKSSKRHTQEMDHHLEKVQQLRSSYFEAEAHQKSLIKYILEKWAELKLLRKDQQFQCTRFQLRLHVEQPQDIGDGYANVKEHFDQDLSEMYRERLERYYTEKRKWYKRKSELKPPRKPNIDRLREELKTQYAQCFYEPEEPRVHVLRIHVNKAFLYQNLPTPHKKLKTFYAKIYFDGQFVDQTRSYRLEPDLHLYMNESMGILLERHMPEKLSIKVFEKSMLTKDKKLATMEMTLLDGQQSHKLSFIGSECAGDLFLNVSLEEEVQQQQDKLLGSLYGNISYMNTEQDSRESEDFDNDGIDENDSLEDNLNETYITATTDIFEEDLIQFCDINEMLNNKRFRLLRSRYEQNDPRTKNLRFIPAFEHEISFDWESETDPVIDPGNWMDPIDLHKHNAKKLMKNTYESVNTYCARMSKLMENTENLLVGNEPATWSGLFRSLFSIFKTPRPLQGSGAFKCLGPPQCLTPDDVQTFNIVLNIVRATGIPVRSRQMLTLHDGERNSDSSSNMLNSNMFISQTLVYSNVRPFIVLSYKDKQSRSSTVEGSNPTWNEQLILSIKGSVNELCDDLKIILYDEIIEQQFVNDDLSTRGMDIYQRVQTNWLGEYRVPISSLIVNQKFEGCFELTVPKVIVGYKRPTINSVTNVSIESYPEMKEAVHIWCYLSIEPKVELPRLMIRSLECSELNEMRLYLQQCSMEMKQLQPTRYVDSLVCTVTGQRVCLTRLLEPVPLIDSDSGEPEKLIDIACRFVSLQSVYKGYDACLCFGGLWLDSKTLLDNAWCSAKDLGVLLCNYLLALNISCWLVLGLAAPYGECTFVLYRQPETGELQFIAPHTGKRYTTKDVQCPLSRVYYIIAKDNIYLNIQSEKRVTMTNFNLHDTACWLSTFNKHNPAPSGDIQEREYTYNQTGNIDQLRKNIERKVMKKISAWRPMRRTMWNRAFQPQLLSILEELESLATHTNNSNYEEPKFSEQLENEFSGYRIFGFTLNFPYTNLKSISELIRSTGIHLNNDRYVEFSLAVHIHPYPNNVLSCWIFLISVIPL